jgi:CRP/FNR family cyclic AMP-dependent transcriptional regulator
MEVSNMENLVSLDFTPEQKIEALKKFRWIKDDFSDAQIAELATYLKPYEAAIGTVVLVENKKINYFAFVCDGEINIVKENTAGVGKLVKAYSSGNVIGLISFFDEGNISSNAIVQQFATMLVMDRESFESFCQNAVGTALLVSLGLNKILSQNLRETTGKLADAI